MSSAAFASRIWLEMGQSCFTRRVDEFNICGCWKLFPNVWEISKWNVVGEHDF